MAKKKPAKKKPAKAKKRSKSTEQRALEKMRAKVDALAALTNAKRFLDSADDKARKGNASKRCRDAIKRARACVTAAAKACD